MLYTIKKGWHYSMPLFKMKLDFLGKNTNQSCAVRATFNRTNVYALSDASKQLTCNKLFGYSQGHHHKNSVRVCWFWNPSDEKIHLCYYAYENGKNLNDDTTLFHDMCGINILQPVDISLSTYRLNENEVEDRVRVYVNDELIASHSRKRQVDNSFKIGYYMTPYFGGTAPSPQDMSVSVIWH